MQNNRNLELTAEFDEKDFVRSVYNDRYILVVGSEVILNRDDEKFKSCSGDVNKYIVSLLNHTDYAYDTISQMFTDGQITEKQLNDKIEKMECSINDVSPQLLNFLSTKLFKFVITTTVDHYMKVIMDNIWGVEGWQECNMFDDESLVKLQKQIENNSFSKPTLFYLFGHSDKNTRKAKFVMTDNDAIKLIANNWITREGVDIRLIKDYITNKRLLALGCKFEDWYFRFFWYCLKGGLQGKDSLGKLDEGEVAVTWQDTEPDINLKRYLDNTNNVSILPDARLFMNDMTNKLVSLEPNSPFRDIIINSRKRKGIFLSYNTPDFPFVYNVFQMLVCQGYAVWIDNEEIHTGDTYTRDIQEAIADCRIFMPVISPQIQENLEQDLVNEDDNFFCREWGWARQKGESICIMPIGINGAGKQGFNLLNRKFFGIEKENEDKSYVSGTDLTQIGAWNKLLKDIESIYNQ